MDNDREKLLEVNNAFYEAFAAGDYDALSAVWSGTKDISVIHPGNDALHGYPAVMDSWRQILSAGGSDICCANARPYVFGDSGYIICHEIFPQGKLIATNVFIREGESWLMVHHQAGPDTISAEQVRRPDSLH